MPTFYKKTSRPSFARSSRQFIVHGKRPALKTGTKKPIGVKAGVTATPPVKKLVRTPVIPVDLEPNLEELAVKPMLKSKFVANKADATMELLDNLLNEENKRPDITEKTDAPETIKFEEEDENAVYLDETQDNEVESFDGVNSLDEQEELYQEVVDYEKRKTKVVAEQLKMIAKERDEERKALEKEIRTLKQELHRTNPIQDNKFFSLSKQLRDAIQDIQRIAEDSGLPVSEAPVALPEKKQTEEIPAPATPSQPQPQEQVKEIVQTPAVPNSGLSKKKTLITGAVAVAILLAISGFMITSFAGKPKVNDKLVAEYLEQQGGKVQGVQTANEAGDKSSKETDPSQADVSFEASDWVEFKDPTFGILLQYPKNAVKAIRTDSNVTFIRKTGYLFKIQRVETALTLDEYWKQIKATSLNYEVSEDKFKGKKALKLNLEDKTDYPGDRILVKEGNFIYDVWYATPSVNFPEDDILRAEKMLSSLSIVGDK